MVTHLAAVRFARLRHSSGAMVCVSPHVLSANLIKSTPWHCRRTSVIIVHVVGQHADGGSDVPTGELVINDAAICDKLAGAGNARSLAQASRNGIAQRHIDEPGATRHGEAGHPAAQDLLGIARRPEGVEAGVGGTARARDVRHLREPKGEMTVTIDESGHDPLFGGINDLHVVLIFDRTSAGAANTPNAVASMTMAH